MRTIAWYFFIMNIRILLNNGITKIKIDFTGFILGMGSANDMMCHYGTPSLIGRARTQNDPWYRNTYQTEHYLITGRDGYITHMQQTESSKLDADALLLRGSTKRQIKKELTLSSQWRPTSVITTHIFAHSMVCTASSKQQILSLLCREATGDSSYKAP